MASGLSYHEVFVVHGPSLGDLVPVWGLLGVAVVCLLVLRQRDESERVRPQRLAARAVVVVAPLLALGVGYVILEDFGRALHRYRNGAYSVVEGTVTDMTPGSEIAHRSESFRVGGERFEYSTATISPYFHQTVEQGGPIRPGLRVRISHVNGDILRIEVGS